MHFPTSLLNRRAFITGIAALAGNPAAWAGGLAADAFVQRMGTWVVRLAASNRDDATLRQELIKLFSKHVDVDAVARFALGKYGRRMPADLQQEYHDLILHYVATLFVRYRRKLAALEVQVKQIQQRPSYLLARSEVVFYSGKTMPVLWRLHRKQGRYQVTDVNLHKVWLSMRLRDKLTSYLNKSKGDFAGLLEKIRREIA